MQSLFGQIFGNIKTKPPLRHKPQDSWLRGAQLTLNIKSKDAPKKKYYLSKRDKYLNNKEEARRLVKYKLEIYTKIYRDLGYEMIYKKVAIRDTKSRWGSCSSASNLNFNYKIILLPDHLVDYIIAHELCHLIEMNHQKEFWHLLSLSLPHYLNSKKELSNIKLKML